MGHIFDIAAPTFNGELTRIFCQKSNAVEMIKIPSVRMEYEKALEEAGESACFNAASLISASRVSQHNDGWYNAKRRLYPHHRPPLDIVPHKPYIIKDGMWVVVLWEILVISSAK